MESVPPPAVIEERLRRCYALVDSGDYAALEELYAAEAVYQRPGYEPFRGWAAIHAFYTGARVIAEGRHLIDRVDVAGRRACVQGRFDGRLKDGSAAEVDFCDVWEFGAEGRAVHRRTYFALAAV